MHLPPSLPLRAALGCWLWLLGTGGLAAQAPAGALRWLDGHDGLPSSRVDGLAQDAHGFLWLSTGAGPARYDGVAVEWMAGDGSPLAPRPYRLVADGAGGLWLGDGETWWRHDGRRAEAVALPDAREGFVDGLDRLLWLGPGGAWQWDGHAARPVLPPVGQAWTDPRSAAAAPEGARWFERFDGSPWLVRADARGTRATALLHDPLPGLPPLALDNGRVLYAAPEGPVLLDPVAGERVLPLAPGLRPKAAPDAWRPRRWVLDPAGRLWVAGEEPGLKVWRLNDHLLADSVSLWPESGLALPEAATALLVDREGNLWIGTPSHGAACLPVAGAYVRNLGPADGLTDNVVLALAAERAQNVWCGLRGGQLRVLNHTGVGGMDMPVFGSAGLRDVTALAALPDGDLLAGTAEGLYRVRLRQVRRVGPGPVRALATGSDGRAYAALGDSLYGLTAEDLDAMAGGAPPPDHRLVARRRVEAVAARPGPGCWYAGPEGLFAYDGAETRLVAGPEALPLDAIGGLAAPADRPVLATRGRGLWWPDPDGPGFRRAGPRDGLPEDLPAALLTDVFAEGDSVLWTAGHRGVARLVALPDGAWEARRFDMQDGLASQEANAVLALRGTTYVGTNRGLSYFRPEALTRPGVPPGIRLTGVRVGDRDTALLDAYRLAHDQDRLVFRFRGIAPGSGHRLRYRYRLEGLEEAWREAASGEVRYTHLPAGDYRFAVEALGPDGTPSPAPATLAFRIDPPWWATGWFLVLSVLSGLVLATVIYGALLTAHEKRVLQRAVSAKTLALDRKERELRQRTADLEEFAYVASHDLKEPLRNIANYVQLFQRRAGPELDADTGTYLGFVVDGVKRMYGMLDGLKAWSALGPEGRPHGPVDGNALLASVLDGLPAERRVVVRASELPPAWGDAAQLRQLLEQLIDNAVKFHPGPDARVAVDGVARADEVEWRVADNGPGLDERYADRVFQIFERAGDPGAVPGSGVGLALCRKIAERHGGRIWYRSDGRGTTFHVTLPRAGGRPSAEGQTPA